MFYLHTGCGGIMMKVGRVQATNGVRCGLSFDGECVPQGHALTVLCGSVSPQHSSLRVDVTAYTATARKTLFAFYHLSNLPATPACLLSKGEKGSFPL